MKDYENSEDLFAETRMSFGEHLDVLRTHLLRALYGLVIAVIASFFFGRQVVKLITAPVEKELMKYHEKRMKEALEKVEQEEEESAEATPPQVMHLTLDEAELQKLRKK